EQKKLLKLLKPSIINGSQTQGVLNDFYRESKDAETELPTIHVTFELIVTNDDELIAETSIARNFQNDVMTLSIAGRLGQLDELERSLQQSFPITSSENLRQSSQTITSQRRDSCRLSLLLYRRRCGSSLARQEIRIRSSPTT